MSYEDALFPSAHSALMFAFNFSASQYERPTMNRLAAPALGTGKGLGGLDGAAQAGMILAELGRLSSIHQQTLTARLAPRWFPCSCVSPCCSGKKINPEWKTAMEGLRDGLQGVQNASKDLQLTLLTKYFGNKMTIVEVADEYALHRDTVSKHYSKIAGAMRRDESRAWGEIEDLLQKVKIVASTT